MAHRFSGGGLTDAAGIAGIGLTLVAFGVVMVASTSVSIDTGLTLWPLWKAPAGRQLMLAAGALLVMALSYRVAITVLARPRLTNVVFLCVFGVTLLCLAAVLLSSLGAERHGSRRWLGAESGGVWFAFQPSEPAKLALAGFLAVCLGRGSLAVRSFRRGFLPAAVAVAATAALVGIADFGTAALIAVVGTLVMFVAGCRVHYLFGMASLGAGGSLFLLRMETYRLDRLTAYRDIWADPRGLGYHPIQSLVTIVSGGWFGTGLGAGLQKHGYLPEARTDFIFSVICEETGVLGAFLVIALYLALVWLGLRVVRGARSTFERILAFGIVAFVGLQAAMNIAVATVMAPTTGISLPLISAGGSGLVCFCASIGLLAAIAARAGRVDETATNDDSLPDTGAVAW